MRGDDQRNSHLFSYLSPEQRVPADHPLRSIRTMTDDALKRMSPRFEALYSTQLQTALKAREATRRSEGANLAPSLPPRTYQ